MVSEPDTFARFLDLLTAALEEPTARSAGPAAELHISRSQLDRLVTAAAGEPPAHMRRRIMLERAAYRLVVDQAASILDVAVEAGYSSHEAFTRAFGRSYGTPPSQWRHEPRQLRLGAADRVHFHPPAGLRLPAHVKATSMDLLVTMTEHHLWLVSRLIQGAADLDRHGNSERLGLDSAVEISVDGIDRSPTVRSLLSRLVGQLDMWNHAMADRPYDFAVEQHESLEDLRARLGRCGPIFLGQVREVCAEGRLDDTFVLVETTSSPEFFTYGGMLAHVLAYGAYRRTLVVGALSSAGVTGIEDDPLAWEPVRPLGPTLP
jgi:AraC family transcriptional regulator